MDILRNKPALPNTSLVGNWILNTVSEIHYRSYSRIQDESKISEPSNLKTGEEIGLGVRPVMQIGDGGEFVLEEGWRNINGSSTGERGVDKILDGFCGIIWKSRLWVFTSSGVEKGWPELEGLYGSKIFTIRPSDLVRCDDHDDKLHCLRAGTCEVHFDFSQEQRDIWHAFKSAIVEKISWNTGNRIFMIPSSLMTPPLESSLWPLSDSRLLLTAHPRPNFSGSSLHTLMPLGLSAIYLDYLSLTPTQEQTCSDAFSVALGTSWKSSKWEYDLCRRLRDEPSSDWSVYWVPLDSQSHDWTKGEGVITIWPTHLSTPPNQKFPRTSTRSKINPIVNIPSSSHLLNVASKVHDILAAQRKSPDQGIDVDVPDKPTEFEIEPYPEPEPEPSDTESSEDKEQSSDLDDLFSATSSPIMEPFESVPPEPIPSLGQSIPPNSLENQSLTVAQSSNSSNNWQMSGVNAGGSGGVGETAMITEDDFDFFDSPVDDKTVHPEEEDPMTVDQSQFPERPISPEVDNIPIRSPSNKAPSPEPPDVDVDRPDSPPIETHIMKTSPLADIIPDPFSPISLDSAPYTRPALYSSITSGSTYTRKPTPGQKYDYASNWDLNSDSSSSSDMDETSDAPPTPRTEYDGDFDMTFHVTPAAPQHGHGQGEPITFRGHVCVGAEWVVLKDDLERLVAMAKPWDPSWKHSNTLPSGQTRQSFQEKSTQDQVRRLVTIVTLDPLLSNVILSRTTRALIPHSKSALTIGKHHSILPDLTEDGISLSELDIPEVDKSSTCDVVSTTYGQLRVNLAFHGHITNMSIAGLKLWRELGLEPAGGRKNFEAWIVIDGPDEWRVVAEKWADRFGESWEAHRLGKVCDADRRVVCVQPGKMVELAMELDTRTKDTSLIIFIFSHSIQTLNPLFSSKKSFHHKIPILLLPPSLLSPPTIPEGLLFDTYNSLPRHVRRIERDRTLPSTLPSSDKDLYMQHPSFTLVPDTPPKSILSLKWPVENHEVLDRDRIVHCAYSVDKTTGLVVACVMDDQGEQWQIQTWMVDGVSEVVGKVWDWVCGWHGSQGSSIEMAVVRMGEMSLEEYEAWKSYSSSTHPLTILTIPSLPPPPPSILSPPKPTNIPASTFTDPSSRLIDESLIGSFHPIAPRPIFFPLSPSIPSVPSSDPTFDRPFTEERGKGKEIFFPTFILSQSSPDAQTHVSTIYHIIAQNGRGIEEEEIKVKDRRSKLGKEYWRLTCLGRTRWGFEGGLPAHVECVRSALEIVEFLAPT
ncbi:hypothetical protein TREMEDRAFT_58289 [Tremella mesenterica DSM 1558]|uniref:uncharacterized protein n=1 Tax=Tremella mesenterica (strain ATCC 24925 / CBS 8224 / DSM 1558 / NBRC 9311 / NRRL Y-6157 / RJB 2259-6 / UBC 559-6) TaxID=578456 RepID=UPI0003F48E4B|nr:uncharacterized protein TREMEDRAFT_58289 [Tremella mesenterica DSM 1558]EIW72133.1 hypothetical protein TREMEDRAFT_58289 [Tremella mesenterica DSM 1558]